MYLPTSAALLLVIEVIHSIKELMGNRRKKGAPKLLLLS